ncbi:aminotransferase-like domain-containing protein [Streptomyces sp. 8N706]|uniref:aminotransferase-like domain-containing protein n=1 Tax=Streptomyces sp. 8N706 TaxID=3457416 RepID=UPI003FD3AA46
MDDYRLIADAVADDIAAGRLRPGDRLATQRAFAREHGIATSTAGRVYRELVRRGLVVGEVGRGTFVRAAQPSPWHALAEPAAGPRIDLELNYPVVPEQTGLLAEGLGHMLRPDVLASALRPAGAAGSDAARDAAAALLTRPGWEPDPARVLFAGNGRQAIAAAVAALVPPGGRLGVEALTYPLVRSIAARLGVTLVPLPTDEAGLRPDDLAATHRSTPLRAVYLQPTLHNPLGVTMPPWRRAELADVLHRTGLYAVEDTIWAFLHDGPPPLAAFAPERTVLVDSLSKRIAPGLSLGLVVTPADRTDLVAAALRSGAWTATGFALDAGTRWMADGAVAAIGRAKRRDAAARQRIVARRLDRFSVRSDPYSYYCWWELPEPWRAETFVAAAARRGIAVTPAAAFVVGSRTAPHAVRIGLASPPPDTLADALGTLAALARSTPDDTVDY